MIRSSLLGWFVLGAAPALGQQLSDVLLVETTQDQIVRLTDFDGDGRYQSPGEVRVLYYDGMGGSNFSSPRSALVRLEGGSPALYWIDTQRDQLFRAVDDSGNGRIDTGEDSRYRYILAFDGPTSPDGLASTTDGALWWCSDGGVARGLFRCIDLNGNDDANDDGESEKLIPAGGVQLVATDAGSAAFDSSNLLRLASFGNVVVGYVQGEDEAAFRFEKLNADSDLADPGEARLFLNATGKNPAFPQNADWQSGLLRSLVLPGPGGKGQAHARLNYLASRQESGQTAWYFATNQAASFNALNILGQAVNGLVFRGVDLNADGDLQEPGEVRAYFDGSLTSGSPLVVDQITGLDAASDGIYLGAIDGSNAVVHRLRDLNGDGDALDAGELDFALFDDSQFAGPSPFFIGSPFVWDIAVAPLGWFQNSFLDSGTPCAPGANKPKLGFSGDAHVGAPAGFELRVENVAPGLPAVLLVGTDTTSWLGLPLPLDLALFGLPGCTLYQNAQVQFTFLTTGSGPSGGVAKVPVVLPNDPQLYDAEIPLQWVIVDSAGGQLAFSKLGVVHLLAP
jgi:hypothetical protein